MKQKLLSATQNILLSALVLLMVVQAAYLLALEQLYPHNTGMISALRMAATDLSQRRGVRPVDGVATGSMRLLSPSSAVLLSQSGDRVLCYTADARAEPVAAAVEVAADLLAGAQTLVFENAFETLLQGDGLLIDLGRPLPASLFLSLSGRTGGDVTAVRRLLLARMGDRLVLAADTLSDILYTTDDLTLLMRYGLCESRLAASDVSMPIGVAGRNGDSSLRAGTLTPIEGETHYPVLLMTNPLRLSPSVPTIDFRAQSAVLQAFSFGSGTLRLHPDGTLTYRATEARFGVSAGGFLEGGERDRYTAFEVILAGYALLDVCLPQGSASGAGLRYMGASFAQREGRLTLYYDYVSGGLPVLIDGRKHAAVLQYESGCFVAADICLRTFEEAYAPPFFPGALSTFVRLAEMEGAAWATASEMVYDEADGVGGFYGRQISPRHRLIGTVETEEEQA